MSNKHVKYLLIGGGVASSSAAAAIRKNDRQGDMLLISQEIHRPYNRSPLSKEFLRREMPKSALFAHMPEWFVANHVELRTGRRMAHIDSGRTSVTLDNGEEISFDRLLFAIGGTPAPLQIPGAHLPNLYYLRTIEDAEHLQHAIDKARREGRPHSRRRGRAVVIGGGVLGTELAASLSMAGLAVDLAISRDHPWKRYLGEASGKLLTRFMEKRGVAIHAARRQGIARRWPGAAHGAGERPIARLRFLRRRRGLADSQGYSAAPPGLG